MLSFTSDQWVIVALIFVLGLLVGGFLFSGGGRKWKERYNAEVTRRTDLEKAHEAREKDWREQDSLREAALRNNANNRPVVVSTSDPRDVDRDGVVTSAEKPGILDRMLGRDRDGDGVPDDRDPIDDRRR